jgi:hypothetical protein
MTKITKNIQSHQSNRKYKSENGRSRTSKYIRGGIRCHGGVSIHVIYLGLEDDVSLDIL